MKLRVFVYATLYYLQMTILICWDYLTIIICRRRSYCFSIILDLNIREKTKFRIKKRFISSLVRVLLLPLSTSDYHLIITARSTNHSARNSIFKSNIILKVYIIIIIIEGYMECWFKMVLMSNLHNICKVLLQ